MKKITRIAKLQFLGGEAKPGPTLASIGVNIMQFCQQFNAATINDKDKIVPVIVTVYNDKSFTFKIKTTPTSFLIKQALGIEKASKNAKKDKAGTLTKKQVETIAAYKMPDLNTDQLAKAVKIVLGTMKQMGVELKEE